MERRRRVANTSNIAVLICQNVGEPPTLHRIQVLQRFQAAFIHAQYNNAVGQDFDLRRFACNRMVFNVYLLATMRLVACIRQPEMGLHIIFQAA